MTARDQLLALEQFGIKLGLEQITALLGAMGRPDDAFPSILIAGTNGKGSVTAMVERAVRAAGHRTGRYTSPHLVHLEERVAIDGEPVSSGTLDHSIERVLEASRTLPWPPSFFEAATAVALDVFRRAAVDLAVLEVGLGGRLDATNAVTPIAVAITRVDFDHEAYLGETLEAIATEKAGVIKAGGLVLLGPNHETVERVISERCRTVGASLSHARHGTTETATLVDGRTRLDVQTPHRAYEALTLGLRGRHQIENALTALRLLEELDATGKVRVPTAAIRAGLEDVTWPGRLEVRHWRGTDLLLDGAHNPSGARALAAYVLETYGRRLPMVVGIMKDKDIGAVLAALAPAASRFTFTAPRSARAAEPVTLATLASRLAPDVPTATADDPLDAVTDAAATGRPVVVAGSLYLVGEVRAELP